MLTQVLRARLAPACLLALLCASASMADTSVGGGFSSLRIESGHPAIGKVSAPGLHLYLGLHDPGSLLSLTLAAGASDGFDVDAVATDTDPFYPPDSAAYGYLELGLRVHPRAFSGAGWQPYLAGAWGVHSVTWDHYVFDQTGAGWTLGGGVLLSPGGRWSLDLGLARTAFVSEQWFFSVDDDEGDDNTVWRLAVTLLYRLGPRQ